MRVTLKLKLILIISFLLLGSLSTYVYFAVNLFVTDKTSYIYDTTLSTTNYLAKDIKNTIYNATENSFTFALIGKRKPVLIKELLGLRTKILAFKIESEKEVPVFIHPKLKELYNIDPEVLKSFSDQFISQSTKELEVVNISDDIKIPALNIIMSNKFLNEKYIYTISIADIFDSFKKNKKFNNYLINRRGEIIIGDNNFSKQAIKKIVSSKFDSLSQKITEGEDQLLSFTKIEDIGLTVVSKIAEKDAFSVTEFLIKKSIAVGIILLSLSIILAFFFSTTITKPLEKLVIATKKISQGEYGDQIEVKVNDEVRTLADSFNLMSNEIESKILEIQEANIKLDYLNKNLEKLVAQRTHELAEANSYLDAMVNSIGQGLIVLDEQGICSPFYTNICLDFFNSSPEGKNFFDLININDSKKKQTLTRWIKNLYDEKIPFESLAELGPENLIRGQNFTDNDFQHLTFQYFPMRRKSESVENILVVATDKSKEIIAEEKFKREKDETSRIMFIQKNRRQFISFLRDCLKLTNEIARLVNDSILSNLSEIKMLLHSIKGSSGVYKLTAIYQHIDLTEEKINQLNIQNDHTKIHKELSNIINLIRNEVKEVIKKDKAILGEELIDGIPRFQKRLDKLIEFAGILEQEGNTSLLEDYKNMLYRIPVSDLFKSTNQFIQDLADQLNKDIKPLVFDGGETLIDPLTFTPFLDSLVHLFRNILDHGIEYPHIREEKGKEDDGEIKIVAKYNDKKLYIEVHDDGAGISTSKIRKAMNNNPKYSEREKSLPDELIIYHIFDENLSTSEKTTDISGRGVGMSAIKMEVDKLGGTITLESRKDQGTSFYFEVPYA